MVITEIRRSHKLLNDVYVDGEPCVQLHTEVLSYAGLNVGSEVTEADLKRLKEASERKLAKSRALSLLSSRDYSRGELAARLKRDFDPGVVDDTVSRMEQLGFLDDEAFAGRQAADMLFKKHYAKRRAEFELLRKKVDPDIVDQTLAELSFDPIEHIKKLIEKKYKAAYTDDKVKRRAVVFLQRYGYSLEDIRRVLRHQV